MKASVEQLASRAASRAMSEAAKNVTPPTTAYQFEVSWRAFSGDLALQARLLKVFNFFWFIFNLTILSVSSIFVIDSSKRCHFMLKFLVFGALLHVIMNSFSFLYVRLYLPMNCRKYSKMPCLLPY